MSRGGCRGLFGRVHMGDMVHKIWACWRLDGASKIGGRFKGMRCYAWGHCFAYSIITYPKRTLGQHQYQGFMLFHRSCGI